MNGEKQKAPVIVSTPSPKTYKLPELIPIPEGEFYMGTSEEQVYEMLSKEDWAHDWYDNDLFLIEQPYHIVSLPAFEIARAPVTNQEYFLFVWNSGYKAPRGWKGLHFPDEMGDHPVVGISMGDVQAYIQWLNIQSKKKYRLPSEAEWERAARGTDGRIYPWGNDFDLWRCNTDECGKRSTTSVGGYSPSGDAQCGAVDIVGNVFEWTTSLMVPYPYDPDDGRENPKGDGRVIVRGGAWYYSRKLARCACREGVLRTYISPALGFRLAHDATPAGVRG